MKAFFINNLLSYSGAPPWCETVEGFNVHFIPCWWNRSWKSSQQWLPSCHWAISVQLSRMLGHSYWSAKKIMTQVMFLINSPTLSPTVSLILFCTNLSLHMHARTFQDSWNSVCHKCTEMRGLILEILEYHHTVRPKYWLCKVNL